MSSVDYIEHRINQLSESNISEFITWPLYFFFECMIAIAIILHSYDISL
jgi:hypothetical protein